MADVVFAVSSTWATQTVFVTRGEAFAADDPLVQAMPDLFTADPEPFVRRTAPRPAAPPVVEDASAVPGELRRGPGRPRKDGSGPWRDGAA